MLEKSRLYEISQGDNSHPSTTATSFAVAVLECGSLQVLIFCGTFALYSAVTRILANNTQQNAATSTRCGTPGKSGGGENYTAYLRVHTRYNNS